VTWDDWVKILTLVGSIVLAYGSWRAQAWTKRQAEIHEDAARKANAAKAAAVAVKPNTVSPAGEIAPPGAVEEAAAEIASQPYFDRVAYIIFFIGFLITTLAGAIDILNHGTLQRLVGQTSPPAVESTH
jgi:hypothetical protein